MNEYTRGSIVTQEGFLMLKDHTVQLNYVIPDKLEDLLSRYCRQNLVSPSALIRRLILEYVEGDRSIKPSDHPKGRRTTVALPERLLNAFEQEIQDNHHGTKAAVIATLLSGFLPNRVHSGDTIRLEADLPVEVFNLIYSRYGPGPIETVIVKALQDITESIQLVKETV